MTSERCNLATQDPTVSSPDEFNVLEEVMAHTSCRGQGDRLVQIIQYRLKAISASDRGERRHLGAIFWRTSDGDPIRQIDSDLYEIVSSGELLEREA